MSDALSQLYPHMAAPASDADLLRSIARKFDDSVRAKQAFVTANDAGLLAMAQALAKTFRNGGKLLTMGNGGSSCDAAHVAVEFMHPITVGRRALPAVHLGADIPMITAIGNDVGFDEVFVRPLLAHAREGDAVLAFSTSGNSKNLLRGLEVAQKHGVNTLAMSGGNGGTMATADYVDHCIIAPSTSVHRVQECHLVAYHVLWDLVHTLLASEASA